MEKIVEKTGKEIAEEEWFEKHGYTWEQHKEFVKLEKSEIKAFCRYNDVREEKQMGIVVGWEIEGKTYENKELIKKLGGKWNGIAWWIPLEKQQEIIDAGIPCMVDDESVEVCEHFNVEVPRGKGVYKHKFGKINGELI